MIGGLLQLGLDSYGRPPYRLFELQADPVLQSRLVASDLGHMSFDGHDGRNEMPTAGRPVTPKLNLVAKIELKMMNVLADRHPDPVTPERPVIDVHVAGLRTGLRVPEQELAAGNLILGQYMSGELVVLTVIAHVGQPVKALILWHATHLQRLNVYDKLHSVLLLVKLGPTYISDRLL